MYHAHFGLSKPLFDSGIAQDAAVYRSAKHDALFANVKLAFAAPDAVVTLAGTAGVGKTTLASAALRASSTRLALAWLNGIPTNGTELLELLLTELGCNAHRTTRIERLQMWRQFLSEMSATDSRVFVAVERAEDLPIEVLRALDSLTAADAHGSAGVNVLLLGQSDLDKHLAATQLDSLRQRIRLRLRLAPFDAQDVERYLRMHVARAGGELERLFAPGTAAAVHRYSGGIARVVDNLCETALTLAANEAQTQLTAELVATAAVDWLGLEDTTAARETAVPVAATAAATAPPLAAVVAPSPSPAPPAAAVPPAASTAATVAVPAAEVAAPAPVPATPTVVESPLAAAPLGVAADNAPEPASAPPIEAAAVPEPRAIATSQAASIVAAQEPASTPSSTLVAATPVAMLPEAAEPIVLAARVDPRPVLDPAMTIAADEPTLTDIDFNAAATDVPIVAAVDFPVLTDAVEPDDFAAAIAAEIEALAPLAQEPAQPAAPPVATKSELSALQTPAPPAAPMTSTPRPAAAAPRPTQPAQQPRIETAYAAKRAAPPAPSAHPAPAKPVAKPAPPNDDEQFGEDALRQTQTMKAISVAKSIDDISNTMAETLFGDADLEMLSKALASAGWSDGDTETPPPAAAPTAPAAKPKAKAAPPPPAPEDDLLDLLGLGADAPLELLEDDAPPADGAARKIATRR